ncbi:DUF5994 family protein [Nocardioides sp. J54]|uniref:DUF5994 family protein n=1 Tax=Nocardioides sp. J54 TaxID=935866 RepID=UPI0012FBEA17|nr:DUF5994 family protein [Nocardioides sp. J54]
MTTSNSTNPTNPAGRAPARLRMAPVAGQNRLDGGWWPRSRDLATELADLLVQMPAESGHIIRALFSPPDWDPAPRRIPIGAGYLKVGSFPRDDTHLMLLTTSNRTILRMLVVPPEFTKDQGEEALLAASTTGNAHTASELLDEVLAHPATDARDVWSDDGGT